MRTKKTKSPPQGYSVNALSKLTGRDRRTLDKILVNVPPLRVKGKTKRYALDAVQAALAAKPDKSLRDEKLTEEVRKLRIRNDRDDGRLISVDDVKRRESSILAKVDAIIEQKLSNEYPSAVAGLDVPQARVYGKRLGDQIRGMFQDLATNW